MRVLQARPRTNVSKVPDVSVPVSNFTYRQNLKRVNLAEALMSRSSEFSYRDMSEMACRKSSGSKIPPDSSFPQ